MQRHGAIQVETPMAEIRHKARHGTKCTVFPCRSRMAARLVGFRPGVIVLPRKGNSHEEAAPVVRSLPGLAGLHSGGSVAQGRHLHHRRTGESGQPPRPAWIDSPAHVAVSGGDAKSRAASARAVRRSRSLAGPRPSGRRRIDFRGRLLEQQDFRRGQSGGRQSHRRSTGQTLINDKSGQVRAPRAWMEPIGSVKRQTRIASPRRAPGVTHGKQQPLDVTRSRRVRHADALEVAAPRRRRPHHVECRPGASALHLGIEAPRVLAQQHARLGQRRWSLLQERRMTIHLRRSRAGRRRDSNGPRGCSPETPPRGRRGGGRPIARAFRRGPARCWWS